MLPRHRLARRTADIPESLYFVGFFEGVLTLGPVGVVAGPLAIGLLVEVAILLSTELNPPAGGLAADDSTDPTATDTSNSGDVDVNA